MPQPSQSKPITTMSNPNTTAQDRTLKIEVEMPSFQVEPLMKFVETGGVGLVTLFLVYLILRLVIKKD